MLTTMGEFVKLEDGRFGTVIWEDYDRDDGYSYLVEVENGSEVWVRSSGVASAINPNEREENV